MMRPQSEVSQQLMRSPACEYNMDGVCSVVVGSGAGDGSVVITIGSIPMNEN